MILAALFANSEKAVSEKLTQEEFNAFAAEATEVQNRLDAQAQGNSAMNGDLTDAKAAADKAEADLATATAALQKANGDLTTALEKANGDLTAANELAAGLQAKANQWDAYKASLTATVVADDSTNTKRGKVGADAGLTAKEQAHLDRMTELKAKYPGLMADIDVPTQE